jgi:diadenosine tetraphosphate (Ap4A) HIT family hydrolase
VWLLNPKAVKQKVARGTISGIGRVHKFHFHVIPDGWLKLDVQEALMSDVALMFSNDTVDQNKIGDIANGM